MRSVRFLAILLILTIASCADESEREEYLEDDDSDRASGVSGELTIFAASSLTEAFEEMRAELAGEYPDLQWTFNFAGSSALRTQLEEGAQADVFASANIEQMDGAIEAGRIEGEPVIFAQNQLVLIVPVDNPAGIESLGDLAEPGTLVVLAQEQVPAGDYTRDALDAMSADREFGADFTERVLENVVSEEPNVRAIVTRVQLGEADAGIVYASDVTPDVREAVLEIEIPDGFNVLAEYPVAIIENAPNQDAARMFIDYLLSSAGQAILEDYGFIVVVE